MLNFPDHFHQLARCFLSPDARALEIIESFSSNKTIGLIVTRPQWLHTSTSFSIQIQVMHNMVPCEV